MRYLPLLLLSACTFQLVEAPKATFYKDADRDGHGDPLVTMEACEKPTGFVTRADDCDDSARSIHPGAQETWYDGTDQDCGSDSDYDADDDGFDAILYDGTDCDDMAFKVNPEAAEVCDGIDNDCDDAVDIDPVDGMVLYVDADGDGHGDPRESRTACRGQEGWVEVGDDCHDDKDWVHPGASECISILGTCWDELDNDCNGTTDLEEPTCVSCPGPCEAAAPLLGSAVCMFMDGSQVASLTLQGNDVAAIESIVLESGIFDNVLLVVDSEIRVAVDFGIDAGCFDPVTLVEGQALVSDVATCTGLRTFDGRITPWILSMEVPTVRTETSTGALLEDANIDGLGPGWTWNNWSEVSSLWLDEGNQNYTEVRPTPTPPQAIVLCGGLGEPAAR